MKSQISCLFFQQKKRGGGGGAEFLLRLIRIFNISLTTKVFSFEQLSPEHFLNNATGMNKKFTTISCVSIIIYILKPCEVMLLLRVIEHAARVKQIIQ